jgi:pimeloyl-ACP methyl ester carboxylesterase
VPPIDAIAAPGWRVATRRLPGGLTLEVAERGPRDGMPIVLLHGITDSWRSFEPLAPHLPADWHVIAPSQRGHGASDKPARGYRTRDFAADIALLIEAMALPGVLLLGHSMGAANAMRLAIDRPDRVHGLIGAGAFASFGDKAELVGYVAGSIEPLRDPVPRALADEFQRSTVATPIDEAFLQHMVDQSLMVPAAVWRAGFAGLLEDDFSAELARIRVPTLLLQGDADAFVPTADLHRLRQALPHAQHELWRGAGHALHWEAPERFARSVAAFAARLQSVSV